MKKEKTLKEQIKKLNSVADSLGDGIDSKIKKTVALLNLLGFYTCASCHGHFGEHGLPYAWVDFRTQLRKLFDEKNEGWAPVTYDSVMAEFCNSKKTLSEFLKDLHPSEARTFKSEQAKLNSQKKDLEKVLKNLVKEFNALNKEFQIFYPTGLALLRIVFISKSLLKDADTAFKKKNFKKKLEIYEKSRKTLRFFEKFLLDKYQQATDLKVA